MKFRQSQRLLWILFGMIVMYVSNSADEKITIEFQDRLLSGKKTVDGVNQFLKTMWTVGECSCVQITSNSVQKYSRWNIWSVKHEAPTFVTHLEGTKCNLVKDYVNENQLILKGRRYFVVKDRCDICFRDTATEGIKMNVLNCHPSHMFCEECLAAWAKNSCPSCRKLFPRQIQLQTNPIAITHETVLVPLHMAKAFLFYILGPEFSYFIYSFERGAEYASYKRIFDFLKLLLFPSAFFFLEILAKQYTEGMLVDVNTFGAIHWGIFAIVMHGIHQRLGLNETTLEAINLFKLLSLLTYSMTMGFLNNMKLPCHHFVLVIMHHFVPAIMCAFCVAPATALVASVFNSARNHGFSTLATAFVSFVALVLGMLKMNNPRFNAVERPIILLDTGTLIFITSVMSIIFGSFVFIFKEHSTARTIILEKLISKFSIIPNINFLI